MRDEDIDFSDIPETTDEQFARMVVRKGLGDARTKEQVTLRLDADVLAWFRGLGKGYQTQINSLLRAYMDAHAADRKSGARRK
jgi:uncharacterized protein (DUF4415 family)